MLQVGGLTETVEVKAETGLNVTQPDVSHTVNEKYYAICRSSRPATSGSPSPSLQMQPGYLPMKPNGDPMFRGSQFNSRINGGQTMATENFFDGAAFGYASGPPAEPGERAARRVRQGDEGHHDELLGPVRPHQRRLHRVHGQVGHQRVPWQRLRAILPTTR